MARLYKEVIAPGADAVGANRREIFINAKDLQSEKDDGSVMTTEEYLALLAQRGLEKLAVYTPVKNMESSVQPDGYAPGKDYVLGDTVTVRYGTIGVEYHTPIESVTRSGNTSEEMIDLELGNGVLTIARKLRTKLF